MIEPDKCNEPVIPVSPATKNFSSNAAVSYPIETLSLPPSANIVLLSLFVSTLKL